jgi:hypothetical protein
MQGQFLEFNWLLIPHLAEEEKKKMRGKIFADRCNESTNPLLVYLKYEKNFI